MKLIFKKQFQYAFIGSLFILMGCSRNPLDVSVSSDSIKINFLNVDETLSQTSENEMASTLKEYKHQIGDLVIEELNQNINRGNAHSLIIDAEFATTTYQFYHSEYIAELEREKLALSEKVNEEEKRITMGFAYLKYHFEEIIPPRNILFLNTLFSPILCSDSTVIISLENYVSPETDIIKSIPNEELYGWQRERMDANYIARDALLGWIQVNLFNAINGSLAEEIILAGKILYVLNAAFPKETEGFILRYSPEYIKWANQNEELIWDFIVKNKMLFKNEEREKTNFLNEGPTTVGLPPESPDRIGQFMGYRIVKGYMLKNKSISLQELIETPYNNILQTYKVD